MTQPTLFDSYPSRAGQAFGAGWIITAPWAHPFWSQYVISLTDLVTPMEIGPPLLYMRSEERRVGKEGRSRWAPEH